MINAYWINSLKNIGLISLLIGITMATEENKEDMENRLQTLRQHIVELESKNQEDIKDPTSKDVAIWLKGSLAEEKVINDHSKLSEPRCIAWFGTKEKNFEQNNGDGNGYGWLSNYHQSEKPNPNSSILPNYKITVKIDGDVYSANNVETFYHMYKFYSSNTGINYEDFAKYNPDQARSAARSKVEGNFDFKKADQVMSHLLHQKFLNNNFMAKALLDTGNKFLFEGNRWGDKRLGMALEGTKLEGANKLGKMLMSIREEIRNRVLKDAEFAHFVCTEQEINFAFEAPLDFNSVKEFKPAS